MKFTVLNKFDYSVELSGDVILVVEAEKSFIVQTGQKVRIDQMEFKVVGVFPFERDPITPYEKKPDKSYWHILIRPQSNRLHLSELICPVEAILL